MKKYKSLLLSVLILLIAGWRCNPDLDIQLPAVKKQLVVDGWIENGDYPKVILTYNSSFFSNLDSASFRSLVASRAKVVVSSGDDSEILTLTYDTAYFPPFVYEGNVMKGNEGRTYKLAVYDELDTVHAQTTIPAHQDVDSMWMEFINQNDTMGVLKCSFRDNPSEINYYRTFTRIGQAGPFIPTLFSCFSDQNLNGQLITLSLNKGNRNQLTLSSNIYFQNGFSQLTADFNTFISELNSTYGLNIQSTN